MVTKIEFDSKVHDILQRPEYAHLRKSIRDWIEGIKEKIKEWLINFLSKAFSDMPSVKSISDNLSTIFIIIGILIIVAIIVFIAVKAGRALEKNNSLREILGEKITEGVTPVSLRQKSSEYAKNGDYRLALRFGYIALLLLMHEHNLVYLEDTKTNEEILQALKKTGFAMLPVVANLAARFNASWYGHKSYPVDVYNEWDSNMKLIWEEVNGYNEKK